MNLFIDTATIIGLFVLRLGIPLLITLAVGYALRRLDAKWEAESGRSAGTATEVGRAPAVGEPGPSPSLPQFPVPGPLPLSAADVFGRPCWELKDCAPETLAACPAHQHPHEPCWLARWQDEGQIPAVCYNCHIFASTKLLVNTQAVSERDDDISAQFKRT